MKLSFSHQKESGSSMAEVLCAVTVLAICMAGLMGALANGFFNMRMTRENQRATQILMEQAEMIRLCKWDQVTNSGFIPTSFTAVYDPQAYGAGQGVTYTGAVAIASVPFTANYSGSMRQITLTLNWATKSVNRSRTLITYVAKDGLQNYVY